jgi:hypothetical protein
MQGHVKSKRRSLFYIAYLGNKEIYWLCKTCCMICVLFSTKCCLFHNFIFLSSSNTFFMNHVLKFKYQPTCSKVIWGSVGQLFKLYEVLSLLRAYHWSLVRPFCLVAGSTALTDVWIRCESESTTPFRSLYWSFFSAYLMKMLESFNSVLCS